MTIVGFQIFADTALIDTCTTSINTLMGYPNGATTYRLNVFPLDPEDTRVAGAVDSILVAACVNMTPEERALYYDDTPGVLLTKEEMIAAGWDIPVPNLPVE